jgi:phage repressor protein C with HTH and peptisase S24 domain
MVVAASCYEDGMFFSGKDWETGKDRGNNQWSQIEQNPASECKQPSTGAKTYVSTGQ